MNSVKKMIIFGCTVAMVFGTATVVSAGASKYLDGGKAKWTGGENSDGILYSNLYDEKEDGIRYEVTVWVDPDWGDRKEQHGITKGLGKQGRVHVAKAATHRNPFVKDDYGYKGFHTYR
ncbi:MAG: hypothetical protein K6G88_15160 [Lachnospiraceae bacterium]|nr:hypothetical protein [Lachnospiraceae bacterium]